MKNIEKPWLDEYEILGIPETHEPYPEKPVFEMLYSSAKDYSNMGVIQNNRMVTYPEIKEHVNSLATALCQLGLKKGDRVATMLPTSTQFLISDYAISRAGLVHIPVSSMEPIDKLKYKLKEGGARAVISIDNSLDDILEISKKINIEQIILTKLEDYSDTPPGNYKSFNDKRIHWFTNIINNTEPSPPEIKFDVKNDIETLLFTGGTTGLSKGCMLTHYNIFANATQSSNAVGVYQKMIRGSVSVLLGIPLFHSYGHSMMHSTTLQGNNIIMANDPRDMKQLINIIKEYYPILQVGVPTQFMNLLKEELKGVSIQGVSGSAELPSKTKEEFEQKTGGSISQGYGLSEMSPTTHLNVSTYYKRNGGRDATRIRTQELLKPGVLEQINKDLRNLGSRALGEMYSKSGQTNPDKNDSQAPSKEQDEKRGSIGIPFPDTEIKIIDIETGKKIPWDEVFKGKTGEMFLKGPQRMLGYWPDPGSGLDNEGYVATGDVVRVDTQGFFYVVDRTKDMIIVSGFKVYSREVDEILMDHQKIERAAVVGIPDPEREGSEKVIAFIQPRETYKNDINNAEIIEYLKTRVARYAVPKFIKFVDQLPLTGIQKVDKKLIREQAIKEFQRKKN